MGPANRCRTHRQAAVREALPGVLLTAAGGTGLDCDSLAKLGSQRHQGSIQYRLEKVGPRGRVPVVGVKVCLNYYQAALFKQRLQSPPREIVFVVRMNDLGPGQYGENT